MRFYTTPHTERLGFRPAPARQSGPAVRECLPRRASRKRGTLSGLPMVCAPHRVIAVHEVDVSDTWSAGSLHE
jgi:hypothetical protein